MPTVAIATEYDDYDGEVYRFLLGRLLGAEVEKWRTEMRFSGDRTVRGLAELYLRKAAAQGVRHALFAIDNDGGARRRPEHDDSHDPADESIEEADRCRVCWLHQALPSSWLTEGRLLCVVVPVQTLETWLLCLRGDGLLPSPEQCYARRVLKKHLFGSPLPPVEMRSELALGLLGRPDALQRLRERRSFRHFEAQLAAWR
jgi:hypothetical protein